MIYNTAVVTKSFYIHWPFCPYKCHFCPFVAIAGQDSFMTQYHKALWKEIDGYMEAVEQTPLDTLFFGGGTPSTYPDDLLLDTFGRLRGYNLLTNDTEVTIEVNPGTVRQEQLPLWKEAGITRLSIGVQSLNDQVLKKLNRQQSHTDVMTLIEQASVFFNNLSIDLILGLPGVSDEEWKQLIMTVVQWPINHISVYFLTVHEETVLFFKVKRNDITLPDEEWMVDLYEWTIACLQEHGFVHYETSNFARPGFESQHNQVYWDHKPYKGFGLGACSFDGERRLQNEKNLKEYLTKIEQGVAITIFAEELTLEQLRLEKNLCWG